jgi:hypothetical protein
MARAIRILLLVASTVVATYTVVHFWRGLALQIAADFYVVYCNVHAAGRDDVPNIYSADAQSFIGEEFFARALDSGSQLFHENASLRRVLDSSSSPFLYASFAWISRDYVKALCQYRILIIVTYFVGIVLLGRYCRLPPWLTIFLFAVLVYFFFPFHADFLVANVNAIQLCLLALALTAGERRPEIAGAILAMTFAAKPNVVLVVAILMISRVIARDFRRLGREIIGGAVGGTIAFVVASFWFETPRVWLFWLNAVSGFSDTLRGVEVNNVTPALPLFQQHGTWISYVIAAVLMAIACVPLARGAKRDDLLLISLGLLIYFMSATLVWLHYLVLCLIPAYALLRTRVTAVVAFVALLLMADVPYSIYFGPSTPQLRANLTLVALVLLYGGCIAMLWRERGSRVPASDSPRGLQ